MNTFKTISKNGQSLFKDKGSKHYGYAYRVNSIHEAKEIIEQLRRQNIKANHVVFAYRIKTKTNDYEYGTDDGEPANSAGAPVLGQLKSEDLWNTMVAVVRFFGGTKLGVPGLIHAYKNTARLAIEDSTIGKDELRQREELYYGYDIYNKVIPILKGSDIIIEQEENQENCYSLISVPMSKMTVINEKLNTLGVRISLID